MPSEHKRGSGGMIVSLIVAIGKNNQLGVGGHLLWHLRDDLKNFKKLTTGHIILMGRKTLESIGKPLPGRLNIIITRNSNFPPMGMCRIFSRIEEGISFAKNIDEEELFVIGGGEIYCYCLENNLVDKIYLTKVDFDGEADVFFPQINSNDWKIVEEKFFQKNQNNDHDFCFNVLMKKWNEKA
jgi:dihydrofolate reductase